MISSSTDNGLDSGKHVVILAGATGDLGFRIAECLLERGAIVRALVRKGTSSKKVPLLCKLGAAIIEVDFNDITELTAACEGGTCVVSALSGLHDVIVELQTNLLDGAVAAGVTRFIPSDYCIDFTKLKKGSNRNLDLRREFHGKLDSAHIKATSIFNGMFTDLLLGQAPVILFALKKVAYWGNSDQLLDFTTIDNTAAFTAAAALDPSTPRFLRIGGEVATVKDLQKAAENATGKKFSTLRIGSLKVLEIMIRITRALFPAREEVFPPWQGMQYLHNMFTGIPKLEPLDNNRYRDLKWTSVQEVLEKRA